MRSWLAACLLGAGVALPLAALADDPPKKPPEAADPEFLEFLGSVGSEDEDWINYLAQADRTDASRVAAAKAPAPASGGKNNDKTQAQ